MNNMEKGWSPIGESQLFVALMKHLGSDCATTGSGTASFLFKSGEEVVRVTVQVVKQGKNSWEVFDVNGNPLPPHLSAVQSVPQAIAKHTDMFGRMLTGYDND